MVCYRESLNNTVIRDRYGRVSPVAGTLHDGLYIDHAVHLAHLGMHVKLDTLLRICIHTRYTEVLNVLHTEHSAYHNLLGI